jgi:trans-2-enoyl-CoA reductase
MKYVELQHYGPPETSVACVEGDAAPAPASDQIRFDVEAFPINPADVLMTEGNYAAKPDLPAQLGAECLGRISAVGSAVTDLQVGDRVMHMGRENWTQQKTVARAAVVKVPSDIDPLQASMLKVNPATAHLMLKKYVELQPGDWVIQNAANSAVGGYVICLARAMGLKTVNIVRRPELRAQLLKQGADLVVVDGPDMAAEVAAGVGDGQVRLGIDAVAGDICQRMAECMADGGVIANYGMLSGKNCELSPQAVVFKDISLRGFWLMLHLGAMSAADVQALYGDLADKVRSGELHAEVEATYGIEDIREALSHAARAGRHGKILVTPNGPPKNGG